MSKLPFTNPPTINLYAEFDSGAKDGLLLYNADDPTAGYDGIKIFYKGPSIPTRTVFTLKTKPGSSQTVSGVTTTDEGGNPVNKAWADDNGVFSYSLKKDLIGTATHTAAFTVTWDDGTEHDPKIIINPTN